MFYFPRKLHKKGCYLGKRTGWGTFSTTYFWVYLMLVLINQLYKKITKSLKKNVRYSKLIQNRSTDRSLEIRHYLHSFEPMGLGPHPLVEPTLVSAPLSKKTGTLCGFSRQSPI